MAGASSTGHAVVPRSGVHKGDTVLILTGKDAGKRGKVAKVAEGRVTIEGLNIAKRHTKPRARQGRTERQPRVQQGGIIEKPLPVHVSNVMVVCPECGQPTRIRHGQVGNASVRLCARCGSPLRKVAST